MKMKPLTLPMGIRDKITSNDAAIARDPRKRVKRVPIQVPSAAISSKTPARSRSQTMLSGIVAHLGKAFFVQQRANPRCVKPDVTYRLSTLMSVDEIENPIA